MDDITRKKWDRAAPTFDLWSSSGQEKRWNPFKRILFSNMGNQKVLFVALGTGLDVACFPDYRSITANDGFDDSRLEKIWTGDESPDSR